MKTNVGQKAFDYMMEASGDILKLSEIARESDIGVADELNTIASNMADFANTILEDGRAREEEIKTCCDQIYETAGLICGVGDKLDHEGDEETAKYLDNIEARIQKTAKYIINGPSEITKFSVKDHEAKRPEMVKYLSENYIDAAALNEAKKNYDLIVFRCDACAKELDEYIPYSYHDGKSIPREKIKVVITEKHTECENNDLNRYSNPPKYAPISLYDKEII